MRMSSSALDTELAGAVAAARHALDGWELAAVRRRGDVRRALGVGDEELSALRYLAHHGSVAQSLLADVTALSRSGAAAMIQRLEHDGFVVRSLDPADRRRRHVELSASGRERLARAGRPFDMATERRLGLRAAAELHAFARLLDELAEAADAAVGREATGRGPAGAETVPPWRRWG